MTPPEIAEQWTELMYRIGRKELWVFEGNNILYFDNLIETKCRRHIMLWIYNTLVYKKKLLKFELLSDEAQQDVINFVNEQCGERAVDEKIKIEVGKVFYTLEYFLNENS